MFSVFYIFDIKLKDHKFGLAFLGLLIVIQVLFNPIALRNAKIVCNFGLSECNRVNVVSKHFYSTSLCH